MRAAWPQHKPMSVRISAHDWVEGGITPDDAVQIARLFKAAGADMIDCSSGQVSKLEKPVYGRMFQTPFADRIRNEAGIGAIAVGSIYEADHANSIIAAGRADLCAVGRPHLANPAWTLAEAARIGYTVAWPGSTCPANSKWKEISPEEMMEDEEEQLDLASRLTQDHHQSLKLWLRMLSCTVKIENEIRSRLRASFGITLPRFDLMAQLERYPQGLRMGELSKRMMVTGGNITGITDQLEQEKLVVRVPDPKDGRAYSVKLTAAGRKAFATMAAEHESWIEELLQDISSADKAN
jgi:DNA-binding MarR family transcriptional regulator